MDFFLSTVFLSSLACANVILEAINLTTSNVNLTTDALEAVASSVTLLFFFNSLVNFKSTIHNLDTSCYTKPSITGFNNTGKLPGCI